MIPGEHYNLTYAPVAGWTSVRLLLALVLLNNWYTVQLDYVLAYPQAPVERDLYMLLPKGFSIQGMDNDVCVFFKDRMMYVLYMDDSILAGPDQKEIEQTVQQMK
jgi:hypothetical protein